MGKCFAKQQNYIILANLLPANVPIMEWPGSSFLLAKCVKNTCGRVYLKCHSSTGVFQTFC